MVDIIGVVFWFTFVLLFLSMVIWLAKHPLSVGACVLLLYIVGSVVVGLVGSFVLGVFLFLTGVSGIIVAFLYVVALCPNPVFKSGVYVGSYGMLALEFVGVGVVFPFLILGFSMWWGFSVEMSCIVHSLQWLRDPTIYGGLSVLIPFLGILLFLCMVSVVVLCGQQKQCLGGHGLFGNMAFGNIRTKRVYG